MDRRHLTIYRTARVGCIAQRVLAAGMRDDPRSGSVVNGVLDWTLVAIRPERQRQVVRRYRRRRYEPTVTTLQCVSLCAYGTPPMTKRCPLILVAAGLLLLSTAVVPSAAAQSQACPLVADADVSNAVGSSVHVSPFMVVDSGSSIQCLFEGDAVGDGVLVGRYPAFFGSEDLAPFSTDSDRLRFLLPDGMPSGGALMLTPVEGIGDTAAWVIATGASAAPDSLGRLLVRRGSDAFVFGTQNGPGALETATLVGKAVLASSM